MKHTDDKIREIFSSKLGEWEADVPQGMWESVSAKISGGAAAPAGTAAVAKGIGAKMIAAIAAAAVAVGALVYAITNDESNQTDVIKSKEQVSPAILENKMESTEEQKFSNENVLAPPVTSPAVMAENTPQQDYPTEITILEKPHGNPGAGVPTSVPVIESKMNDLSSAPVPPTHSASEGDHHQTKSESAADKTELSAAFTAVPVNIEDHEYFFMAETANASSYHWDFGDGQNSKEFNPTHRYAEEGDYEVSLTITNSDESSKHFTKELKVITPGKMLIPTIFSPNGDAFNDYFDIHEKSEGIDFSMIVVRDLSGATVFEGNGTQLWDGNDKGGNSCPEGSYLYYVKGIDRNHQIVEKRGTVFLKR